MSEALLRNGTLLRLYLDPGEITRDGYPIPWVEKTVDTSSPGIAYFSRIPDHVRFLADNRCERCRHPFIVGKTPGEWSPCDEECSHGAPLRWMTTEGWAIIGGSQSPGEILRTSGYVGAPIEAQWRVLTVHHLNGVKHDCRWWNLASLCQRCHLEIQAKVWMNRPWTREHSEWFKPHAAGYYAWRFLGLEIGREEALNREDELLALEDRQLELGGLG